MPTTIRLRIPQTIDDVTLGQFTGYWDLKRRIDREEQEGVSWMPRKVARHILSIFSGVDADALAEVDDDQFQDAFGRLNFLTEFHKLRPRGEFTGGTFTIGEEVFTLPHTLNNVTAGQYEIIEKTLAGGRTMFDALEYVIAILTMWDTPNILKHERELHRRAKLFADELPFVQVYDIAFFLPASNGKTSGPLTQFFMLNARMRMMNRTSK